MPAYRAVFLSILILFLVRVFPLVRGLMGIGRCHQVSVDVEAHQLHLVTNLQHLVDLFGSKNKNI